MRRVWSLAAWAYAVWILLSWTLTTEQLVFGAVVAVAVGAALAPLGDAPPPWRFFAPRRFVATLRLVAVSLWRIVGANLSLARRIWSPSLPLQSGMVVVPTVMGTEGGLAATGIVTSLIVDNQIIDLDRPGQTLQYHAVEVPRGGPEDKRGAINGPTEDLLRPLVTPGA